MIQLHSISYASKKNKNHIRSEKSDAVFAGLWELEQFRTQLEKKENANIVFHYTEK